MLEKFDAILDALRERFPNETFCISCESWAHETGNRNVKFRLSRLVGEACSTLELQDLHDVKKLAEMIILGGDNPVKIAF